MKKPGVLFSMLLMLGLIAVHPTHFAFAADDENAAENNDDDKNNMNNNDNDNDDDSDRPQVSPISDKSTLTGNWWKPRPGMSWQIQYPGPLDTSLKVQLYNIDMFDAESSTIKDLHSRGIRVICYFSAGSYESWRPDAKKFPKAVLGKAMVGWKDEKWLDVRNLSALRPIMAERIKMAADKGCDGIDPDNVEGFENKTGFPLKYSDQIAFNKMISELGHARGMAVGLKNDLSQVDDLLPYFDFQVNEQCFEQGDCDDLVPFIKANKPVYNIEYKGDTKNFCPRANKMNFDSLKKKLELDVWRQSCR